MKFQQPQSPLRKLLPGHSTQESSVSGHSVTGRRASVPVRMNKSSQAGLHRKLLHVVWERMPLWPRKTSFFTETPLRVTSEHVTLKVSFSSAVHGLRYLNKRPNERYLKYNFHNENGILSFTEQPTVSRSQIWAEETRRAWGIRALS